MRSEDKASGILRPGLLARTSHDRPPGRAILARPRTRDVLSSARNTSAALGPYGAYAAPPHESLAQHRLRGHRARLQTRVLHPPGRHPARGRAPPRLCRHRDLLPGRPERRAADLLHHRHLAEKCPDIVARIAADGHEIACHYFWHDPCRLDPPELFEANLRRAIDALETASGQKTLGFRAPRFSLRPETGRISPPSSAIWPTIPA